MPPSKLRIALAQLNLKVGDILGNSHRVIEVAREARAEKRADVIVFPELTLTSYPPEDLVLRPGLWRQVGTALERICREAGKKSTLLSAILCEKTASSTTPAPSFARARSSPPTANNICRTTASSTTDELRHLRRRQSVTDIGFV
ncbi:MAG: nitrilase-related carbon-nitrogen hydrolase [Gammaproteobacteria bacterium]